MKLHFWEFNGASRRSSTVFKIIYVWRTDMLPLNLMYCIFWRIRLLFNPGKSSQKSGVVLYAGCCLIGRVYPKLYILTGKVGGRLIRPVVIRRKILYFGIRLLLLKIESWTRHILGYLMLNFLTKWQLFRIVCSPRWTCSSGEVAILQQKLVNWHVAI